MQSNAVAGSIFLTKPDEGNTTRVEVKPDANYVLGFDISTTTVEILDKGTIAIEFGDGSSLNLHNLNAVYELGDFTIETMDGALISGKDFIEAASMDLGAFHTDAGSPNPTLPAVGGELAPIASGAGTWAASDKEALLAANSADSGKLNCAGTEPLPTMVSDLPPGIPTGIPPAASLDTPSAAAGTSAMPASPPTPPGAAHALEKTYDANHPAPEDTVTFQHDGLATLLESVGTELGPLCTSACELSPDHPLIDMPSAAMPSLQVSPVSPDALEFSPVPGEEPLMPPVRFEPPSIQFAPHRMSSENYHLKLEDLLDTGAPGNATHMHGTLDDSFFADLFGSGPEHSPDVQGVFYPSLYDTCLPNETDSLFLCFYTL